MRTHLKNLYRGRYILITMVRQDFMLRYRRSVMGVLWSLLTPLGLVAILAGVYSTLWGQPIAEVLPYMFASLTPWQFLVASAEGGTTSFLNAEGYIKQLNTPLEIFPLRSMLGALITFLFSLAAYFVSILVMAPWMYSWYTFMLIPALVIWLIMAAGLATITAVFHTYARDYQPMQSLVLQGLFYATPIIYKAEEMAKRGAAFVYEYNPIYYLLEIMRGPLQGQMVEGHVWLISIGIALFLMLAAVWLFRKVRGRIVFKL